MSFIIQQGYFNAAKKEVKNTIIELCISNVHLVVSNEDISFDLLLLLLSSTGISELEKMRLLIHYIKNLSREQAYSCFNVLQLTNFISLFNGNNPRFEKTQDNLSLLSDMKNYGWISYKTLDDEPNFVRAFCKRSKLINITNLVCKQAIL